MNIRIFGPPGTGKTFTLRQTVGHLLGIHDATDFLADYGLELPHKKYSKKDMVFMSHTNSAVDELMLRMGMRRTYRNGLWGTMHGVCLHLLLGKNPTIRSVVKNTLSRPGAVGWWKAKFAREYGIPYDPDEEISVLDGNQFFQAYSRAVNKYFPKFMDMGRVIDMLAIESEQYAIWASEWLRFKKRNKILDFDDMLALALVADVVPDGKVLISDEFQDFGPLQWALFKEWMMDMDYVIVAGDDDQAIFSYLGASPRFMLHDFPADESVVLKKSFRLPAKILAMSQLFIKYTVKDRYAKKFMPRKEGGVLLPTEYPISKIPAIAAQLARRGATVLVLTRTNGQVKTLEEMFIMAKVPFYRFKTRKMQIWKDFVDRILDFVGALRRGEKVTSTEAKFYLRLTNLPKQELDKTAKIISENPKNLVAIKIAQNPLAFIKKAKVVELFGSEKMANIALEALETGLTQKAARLPGQIYVDTIHAAKGREGDVVILLDSITRRIDSEMWMEGQEAFEAEARVWYVGMTRARESLLLIRGELPFVSPKLAQINLLLKKKLAQRKGFNK